MVEGKRQQGRRGKGRRRKGERRRGGEEIDEEEAEEKKEEDAKKRASSREFALLMRQIGVCLCVYCLHARVRVSECASTRVLPGTLYATSGSNPTVYPATAKAYRSVARKLFQCPLSTCPLPLLRLLSSSLCTQLKHAHKEEAVVWVCNELRRGREGSKGGKEGEEEGGEGDGTARERDPEKILAMLLVLKRILGEGGGDGGVGGVGGIGGVGGVGGVGGIGGVGGVGGEAQVVGVSAEQLDVLLSEYNASMRKVSPHFSLVPSVSFCSLTPALFTFLFLCGFVLLRPFPPLPVCLALSLIPLNSFSQAHAPATLGRCVSA